jgi:DNA-directed RNA polymerase specialized sigma subunit
MREIGAALEISESRVSQMHSAIVERMKKMYSNVM